MKLETTIEVLSAIFTQAELTEIANHIGEASFSYRNEELNETAKSAWRVRNLFLDASKDAAKKHNGTRCRWL